MKYIFLPAREWEEKQDVCAVSVACTFGSNDGPRFSFGTLQDIPATSLHTILPLPTLHFFVWLFYLNKIPSKYEIKRWKMLTNDHSTMNFQANQWDRFSSDV